VLLAAFPKISVFFNCNRYDLLVLTREDAFHNEDV
jgi:hypothetical protein